MASESRPVSGFHPNGAVPLLMLRGTIQHAGKTASITLTSELDADPARHADQIRKLASHLAAMLHAPEA